MSPEELEEKFTPILDDVEQRSCVTDSVLDRDVYRLYIATLWANVVLEPGEVGMVETDLEALHELLNHRIAAVLGPGEAVTTCFRFINSRAGERAMKQARLTQNHKDLLLYFSSMILDPEGHRRWMQSITEDPSR